MSANSRVPDIDHGAEAAVLERTVRRHLAHAWRRPIPWHTEGAFHRARRWREQAGQARPLIMDSGCGTGRSSVQIARDHPQALVMGLDKSSHRLERGRRRFALPDNLLLLHADCAVFWLLARWEGWRLYRHYLLYPNPWPKSGHLQRRWYGHPAFPTLLALGGTLELRSNWAPYVTDFARALEIAGQERPEVAVTDPREPPLTDFEEKYGNSGHRLWRAGVALR